MTALSASALETLRRRGLGRFEQDDVLQETLVAVIKGSVALESLTEEEIRAYARCVAVRRLRNALRGERRRQSLEGEWARQLETHSLRPDEALMRREARAFTLDLLRSLPRELSAVTIARDIEGLSTKQTAFELSIPQTQVKSRLLRARKILRKLHARSLLGERGPKATKYVDPQ